MMQHTYMMNNAIKMHKSSYSLKKYNFYLRFISKDSGKTPFRAAMKDSPKEKNIR